MLLLCAALLSTKHAQASDTAPPAYDPHQVDGSDLGGLIDLSQKWLIYGGDDPRFADPAYDDSHWPVATLTQRLSQYGIRDQPIVWYRIHVQVPATAKDLSLGLHLFRGSMEAYVNGVRVGQLGQMRDGGEWRENDYQYLMPIPQRALHRGDLVIAVRAAIGKFSKGEAYFGGLREATLGPSNLLSDNATLGVFENLSSNGYRLVLQAITLFVLIALVFALPRQREYLTLALSFLCAAALNVVQILGSTSLEAFSSVPFGVVFGGFLRLGSVLAFLEFINLVLSGTRTRWVRLIQVCCVMSICISSAWTIAIVSGLVSPTPTRNATHALLELLTWLPHVLLLPALLFWHWRKRRNNDAGLLLIPILIMSALDGYEKVGNLLVQLHAIASVSMVVPNRVLRVNWQEVSDVIANLTLLIYIILRVVRTVREGARYAAEVEAAQAVQKVLLARSREATPGFRVDTVYLPASEVGGDFFLVSPGADGSLVAIVGDVAGKGMLAAMRVSVILGILRREDSREPGTILSRLNDAMMLQGDMGLTTACCVRIERDGRYSVANAGHISPYIAGREVATAGALPLGIALDQEYVGFEGWLAKGEALVLMSDGVVEARSSSKELYGFERLSALTRLSAAEIANAAKLFGQEDDITVLSLVCVA